MNTQSQTQMQFPVHVKEKTREGEMFLNASRKKLEGNCGMLIRYWQRNNIWLSNKNASLWLDVNNLIQRIPDLKKYGVQIDDREVKGKRSNYKEFRLKCTCKIVGGCDVTDKCWVHDTKLRLA